MDYDYINKFKNMPLDSNTNYYKICGYIGMVLLFLMMCYPPLNHGFGIVYLCISVVFGFPVWFMLLCIAGTFGGSDVLFSFVGTHEYIITTIINLIFCWMGIRLIKNI